MKKQLFLISLIFAMFVVYGQEVAVEPTVDTTKANVEGKSFCPHKIWVHAGGAFTNNIYNRYNTKDVKIIDQRYSNLGLIEFGYSYFFTEHWGLGLGVTLSHQFAKAVYGGEGEINYNDPNYIPTPNVGDGYSSGNYTLYYDCDKFNEKQKIWAIEIPLVAQFQHKFGNGKNGLFASLGFKGYFPFSSRAHFNTEDGSITYSGRDEFLNVNYPSSLTPHFGTYAVNASSTKLKMRCSVDLQADFGGIFGISRSTDLYVGVYCSYGFLDILPKPEDKETYARPEFISNQVSSVGGFEINGLTNSAEGKWHLLQIGLKLGFHFNACANPNAKDGESMKDLKRRFMNDMINKANEPIVIKTTEYVYIVPVCPEETPDQTQEQKDNIKALAEVLSNTKILFDLDKDIPKITEYNDNINRTVEILKRDRSLKLVVEGYTCDLGSEEHNRDLANRRANKIRDLFISKGVPSDQIETAAYTVNNPENSKNIPDKSREEHRAAIFRILTR